MRWLTVSALPRNFRYFGYALLTSGFIFAAKVHGYSTENSFGVIGRVLVGAVIVSWIGALCFEISNSSIVAGFKDLGSFQSAAFMTTSVTGGLVIFAMMMRADPLSDNLIHLMQFAIGFAMAGERTWLISYWKCKSLAEDRENKDTHQFDPQSRGRGDGGKGDGGS